MGILREMFSELWYYGKSSLRYITSIIQFLLPYGMWGIGYYHKSIDMFVFIWPILVMIFIAYFNRLANKLGKGKQIPVPNKRFTEVDDDGVVSIRNDRVEELILYMDNLENYLERKCML